jgi:hypothetical protein
MKGTMTYVEFVKACQAVLDHHSETRALLRQIKEGEILSQSKAEFDMWVASNCETDVT